MAERRPLVLINGRTQELPNGDTLPGLGGGGSVLSPSQITSWQNNYNPSSWGSGVQTLRLDGNTSFNFITGLAATSGGHRVKLLNVGNNPIGLYNDNSSSTAANRFEFGGRDLIILPGRAIELEYDGTSSRWRAADSVNIWSEPAEWVNYDRTDNWINNSGNIGAPNFIRATATAAGGTVENNVGTSSLRPRNGVVSLSTGTSSSQRAFFSPAVSGSYRNYTFHDGTSFTGYHFFETSVKINTLSDGTDTFQFRVGWQNGDANNDTNGLYLLYTHGTNSGQWVLRGRSSSSNTDSNSSLAVVAGTWYRIRIIVYPDGTAAAWVNGTMIASLSSGLPGAGQDFSPFVYLAKSAGTSARTVDVDYIGLGTVYNSAR